MLPTNELKSIEDLDKFMGLMATATNAVLLTPEDVSKIPDGCVSAEISDICKVFINLKNIISDEQMEKIKAKIEAKKIADESSKKDSNQSTVA